MKTHTNTMTDVVLMWKEKKDVRFNVKKGVELNVGDFVFYKKDGQDVSYYYRIDEIIETRQSSFSNYNYVTTISETVKSEKTNNL